MVPIWRKSPARLLFYFTLLLLLVACDRATPVPTVPETAPSAVPTATVQVAEVAPTATPEPAPLPTDTTVPPAVDLTGPLVVGVNAEFKPFEYVDEQGELAGFDIDLIKALAAVGELDITFADREFASLIPGVVTGELDLAISAITITAHRQTQVAFTDPYFETGQAPVAALDAGQALAVRADNSTLQSIEALTDTSRVGVQSSTTGDFFLTERTPAQIIRFDTADQALQALANAEIDAVLTDAPVIDQFIKDNPELNLQMVSGTVNEEQYAIAVSNAQPALLARLNELLAELRANGDYDRIFNQWFGTP